MQEGADPVSQTGNRVDHTLDHAGNPVDQPLDEIFAPLKRLPRQSGNKPDGRRESIGNHGIQPGKDRAESTVSTPCFSPEAAEVTTCRIPDQIWEATFLILFQIFAASEASCEKLPVTRSISRSTGARITFFSSSKVTEAIWQIPDQIPYRVFFAFSHKEVIVVTTSWTMGFCRIAFQVFVKNADTCDHRPLHQSGMAEKKPMKV